jgi:methionyl-tRNA synthetase
MLFGLRAGWNLPAEVPANEFYNLEGGKFSTSKNWTIPLGPLVLRHDPELVRFHLLASTPETADSEWRWEDYQRSVNHALADTIGNLATRVLRFAAKHFEGRVPPLEPKLGAELDRSLLAECGPIVDPARSVLDFRFRRATEELVANAAAANVFIDRHAPWGLRTQDPARAAAVLNTACNWLALLARWMSPFLPKKAQELWLMVGGNGSIEAQRWPGVPVPAHWRLLAPGTTFGTIAGPFPKISDEAIEAERQALHASSTPPAASSTSS